MTFVRPFLLFLSLLLFAAGISAQIFNYYFFFSHPFSILNHSTYFFSFLALVYLSASAILLYLLRKKINFRMNLPAISKLVKTILRFFAPNLRVGILFIGLDLLTVIGSFGFLFLNHNQIGHIALMLFSILSAEISIISSLFGNIDFSLVANLLLLKWISLYLVALFISKIINKRKVLL